MRVEQSTGDPDSILGVTRLAPLLRRPASSAALIACTAASLVLCYLRMLAVGRKYIPVLDLQVYRAGAHAWLAGQSLYDPHFSSPLSLPFVYPPFSAVLFTAFNVMPLGVARFIMWSASVFAALVASTLVLRRLNLSFSRALGLGCAAGAATLLLEPAAQNLGFGQINMVLMGLVVADLLVKRAPWPRGTLIGIAAAIKLTPIAFLLFFLVRRQWRPTVTAIASFVVCGLIGALALPRDSFLFWSKEMFLASQRFSLAYATNQSLRGVLHRFALPTAVENMAWVALVIAVGLLALLAVRRCLARGDELLAMVVIAAVTLLASPVSWSAHWVWITPALVLFTYRTVISRSLWAWAALVAAVTIFAIGPHSLVPQNHNVELHWTWWQHLVGDTYVLCGLGFLVVVALRSRPVPQPQAAPVLAPAAQPELAGTLAED